MDLHVANTGDVDLRDTGVLKKYVASLLGEFTECVLTGLAVDDEVPHLSPPGLKTDLWFLGFLREGDDAGDLLVDVLICLLKVNAGLKLDRDHGHSLSGRGLHLLDLRHTADGLLDDQDDPALDFLG